MLIRPIPITGSDHRVDSNNRWSEQSGQVTTIQNPCAAPSKFVISLPALGQHANVPHNGRGWATTRVVSQLGLALAPAFTCCLSAARATARPQSDYRP